VTIKRVWHGWTEPGNAEAYETLLKTEVLPGIEAKNIPGYRGIEVLRLDRGGEVEFVTIMTFDSLDNVIDFQGQDYRRCYVPDAAQKVLKRWDQVSDHYEVKEERDYG
jgi:antibiotic biosynthesis monooxygenase (ABM) superfamily enzyme